MESLTRLPERIQAKIMPVPDGCWLWTASTDEKGYGYCGWKQKVWRAHRLVYTILVGDIPAGLQLDHLCRVTSCVNPKHLDPVTNAENMRRNIPYHWQRKKTHCPKGHPYEGANLYTFGRSRHCRTCGMIRQREYRARKNNAN